MGHAQLMIDWTEVTEDWAQFGPRLVTTKGDLTVRSLLDRHYRRKSVGNSQFCRPGKNLVLRTADGKCCWVSWQGIRDDGFSGVYECTAFRNEAPETHSSSYLIKMAVYATLLLWGPPPSGKIITYVDSKKVKTKNPGFCFLKGGFQKLKKKFTWFMDF